MAKDKVFPFKHFPPPLSEYPLVKSIVDFLEIYCAFEVFFFLIVLICDTVLLLGTCMRNISLWLIDNLLIVIHVHTS